MDFLLGGKGHGDVASALLRHNGDLGALKPFYVDGDDRNWITLTNSDGTQRTVTTNTTATLRKDEWILLDRNVQKGVKKKLRLVRDFQAAGGDMVYDLPNGMAHTILQWQRMTDVSDAEVGMNPSVRTDTDRPEFDLQSVPLPIIHTNIEFGAREILVSRNAGTGIDVLTAQLRGERVAEAAEKMLLGVGNFATQMTYAGASLYSLRNAPDLITEALSDPAGGGWVGHDLVVDILNMRQSLFDNFQYGPYLIYYSPAWDRYLDEDYSAAKGTQTLRRRLEEIPDIGTLQRLDYLPDKEILMVAKDGKFNRIINGFGIQTVQWQTNGGLDLHWKIMMMLVPHIRSDVDGNGGVALGTV